MAPPRATPGTHPVRSMWSNSIGRLDRAIERSEVISDAATGWRTQGTGFGYSAGVIGRPFGNEINGTLDKIRAITCDKSAKSLRSNQTNTSDQCLERERQKSPSPRPGIAHQISPFRWGPGWFAFSSGPFRPLSSRRRCCVTEDLCSRQQLLLLQLRHPQPCLRNADRQFWICATPITEVDFCALQVFDEMPPSDYGSR
jgi:hypothetical protein